jgi:hypothetical protein
VGADPIREAATVWLLALHSLFLTLTCPHPITLLPIGSGYFSSQTFSRINTPTFSIPVLLHTYSPVKMEQTECSETLAFKLQTLVNHPEKIIQHSKHSESLKSKMSDVIFEV